MKANRSHSKSQAGEVIAPAVEEFLVKPQFDQDGVMRSAGILTNGQELPDPTPLSPPVGYTPPNDLAWMIRHMIEQVNAKGTEDFDSEEEANDFEIEDDPLDPLTEYEKVFVPPVAPAPPGAATSAAPSGALSTSTASADPTPVGSAPAPSAQVQPAPAHGNAMSPASAAPAGNAAGVRPAGATHQS